MSERDNVYGNGCEEDEQNSQVLARWMQKGEQKVEHLTDQALHAFAGMNTYTRMEGYQRTRAQHRRTVCGL